METTHTITARQAAQLMQLGQAHNEAQAALVRYFTAVADGLDLPVGTELVRVEDTALVVKCPEA